jgi:predicted nucleotide-binding protein
VDTLRKIFVIHGRDLEVRECFVWLLQDLGLEVLEWESLVDSTGMTLPFLLDVIFAGISAAQAVLVILTPDDVTRLHPDLYDKYEPDYEMIRTMQPRPNVLIELGMALAARRERTIIVHFGHIRPIADLAGLNVIRFDGTNAMTALTKVVGRLKKAGCFVRESDYASRADSFDKLLAHARQVPGY